MPAFFFGTGTGHMNPRLFLPCLSVLLIASTLSSCGVWIKTRSIFGEKLEIDVEVSDVANNGSPVAMDVVYVYDNELLKNLVKMTAREWFERKEQVLKDYPRGKGAEIWSFEWAPGYGTKDGEPLLIPLKGSAIGGLIFMNYYNEGPHRESIDLFEDFRVVLGPTDFRVETE